jgi:hypothetical protein
LKALVFGVPSGSLSERWRRKDKQGILKGIHANRHASSKKPGMILLTTV